MYDLFTFLKPIFKYLKHLLMKKSCKDTFSHFYVKVRISIEWVLRLIIMIVDNFCILWEKFKKIHISITNCRIVLIKVADLNLFFVISGFGVQERKCVIKGLSEKFVGTKVDNRLYKNSTVDQYIRCNIYPIKERSI